MLEKKLTVIVVAFACCFALLVVPALASAQIGGVVNGAKHGIQKGATEAQKGVEGAVDKTKEGAEAVGRGTKKAITGEDDNSGDNRMKPQESNPQSDNRMKSGQSQADQSSTQTESTGETQQKNLPKTAGELPLLALAGYLSLLGAGVSRLVRR